MSGLAGSPFRHHFDDSIPAMTFRDNLSETQWSVLSRMADDDEFGGASDANVLSLLFTLIRTCRMRRVLQIGTRIGFSAIVMAAAITETGGFVLTIDPWVPSVEKAKRYIAAAGVADRVRLEIGKSLDAETLRVAGGGDPWDLIYIDGDHDYATIRPELDAYWPLLCQGGMLVCHDASQVMAGEDSRGEGGVSAALADWRQANGIAGCLLLPPIWNSCGAFMAVKG